MTKIDGFLLEDERIQKYIGYDDDITTPMGANSIARFAFQGKQFKSVRFSKDIETIGENAFDKCKIDRLYLDAKKLNIYKNAFKNSIINEIYINNVFDYANYNLENEYSSPFNSNGKLYISNAFVENLVLDKYAMIKQYCFSGYNYLKSIDAKEGLVVKGHSFSNCKSLESIRVRNSLVVESYGFLRCEKLIKISLDKGNILDNAFNYCPNLKDIRCPSKDTVDFEFEAFHLSGYEDTYKNLIFSNTKTIYPDTIEEMMAYFCETKWNVLYMAKAKRKIGNIKLEHRDKVKKSVLHYTIVSLGIEGNIKVKDEKYNSLIYGEIVKDLLKRKKWHETTKVRYKEQHVIGTDMLVSESWIYASGWRDDEIKMRR